MKQTRLTIVRITSNLADLMSGTVPRQSVAGECRYAAETLKKLGEITNDHPQITLAAEPEPNLDKVSTVTR